MVYDYRNSLRYFYCDVIMNNQFFVARGKWYPL